MSKLDKILNAIDVYDDNSVPEHEVSKTKQKIKDLMLELIGEDEFAAIPVYGRPGQPGDTEKLGRDKLKAGLRQKIQEL